MIFFRFFRAGWFGSVALVGPTPGFAYVSDSQDGGASVSDLQMGSASLSVSRVGMATVSDI